MSPHPVLQLRRVTKIYPGPPEVRALEGIDLEVRHGELVAVMGPSGSGKSTLLHIMGALDRVTSGSVEIDELDVATRTDKELSGLRSHSIGFVFQDFFLISGLDAIANVAEGLIYRGIRKKERIELAAAALERVGLGQRMSHRPDQLSGGERQRVAIARALVGTPSIMFADEPTGNLDTKSSEDIAGLFTDLNEDGATIVVITHERDLARRFPRIVELQDGSIVSDSAP